MATLTCITCHVAFGDPGLQRCHYKSDWHRYNLKRKVVGMPPVSALIFQEKVKEHRITSTDQAEGISGFFCKICQKRFSTHNSFENHKKSKKHKEIENRQLEKIRLSVNTQDLLAEKDGDIEDDDSTPILNKVIADARADMEQPKILRSEEQKPKPEFESGDNPRLRWFQKQARALEDDDSDEWEDVGDEDGEGDMIVEESGGDIKDEDADLESLSSVAADSAKQRQLSTQECLFCLKSSKDLEENVLHMSRKHGFFIPDIEYLVDLKGLIVYLGEKVGIGNVCLWCNEKGKAFYSLSSVLKHMKDKGHCNMLVTGDAALEYADFYDFGGSGEAEESMESDGEEVESTDNVADGNSQDLELVLPSGSSIGHRSLLKYYKQNFPTVERPGNTSRRHRTLGRLISQYKAIGWHSSGSSQMARMHKDLAYVQSMKAKYRLKLSSKNNKTQMKHFRNQVVF